MFLKEMKQSKINIFKKNAKTFYFASFFFQNTKQKEVETLYNFCRYVDDIGDQEEDKKKSKQKLSNIIDNLNKKESSSFFVFEFIKLMKKYNIKTRIPIQLVEGVISDLDKVNIKTHEQLLDYSYKVAGTVGLMMCYLMNIKDKELLEHAIELGIAMQITNIVRDVKEDLEANRIYIPTYIRGSCIKDYKRIIRDKKLQKQISVNIKELVSHSETLYDQSVKGIRLLPLKFKFVILLAANLYREIGREIIKEPLAIWNRRVFVSKKRKIIIFLQTILSLFRKKKVNKKEKIQVGYLLKQFNVDYES